MHMNGEVIRDLLPLYHDGVCSSESKALVEQHLKNCLSCKKELETMDAEFTPAHIEVNWKRWMQSSLQRILKAKK